MNRKSNLRKTIVEEGFGFIMYINVTFLEPSFIRFYEADNTELRLAIY